MSLDTVWWKQRRARGCVSECEASLWTGRAVLSVLAGGVCGRHGVFADLGTQPGGGGDPPLPPPTAAQWGLRAWLPPCVEVGVAFSCPVPVRTVSPP